MYRMCPDCKGGRKLRLNTPCKRCGGKGIIPIPKTSRLSKFILILMFLILVSLQLRGQHAVYITKSIGKSCMDVLFVDNPNRADFTVNIVAERDVTRYPNAWFITESRATIILREVQTVNTTRKTIRVYVQPDRTRALSYLNKQRYTALMRCP